MQEKLCKTRAKSQILEGVQLGEEQQLQEEILVNHRQSLDYRKTKKKNSKESHSQQDSNHLNPVYRAEQEKKRFSSDQNIVNSLCHLVKQQSTTDIELDVFDGNPLDFYYFVILLHEIVEKRIDDPRGKVVDTGGGEAGGTSPPTIFTCE